MTKLSVDIAIVGAGPAGTSTAIAAARKGVNTLILERKTNPGIPVQCGEAIGKTGPGIAEIGIPENCIINPIRGFRVYSPSGIAVDFAKDEIDGYIIDRRVFDKELLVEAVEAGSEVLVGTNVVDLKYKDGTVRHLIAKKMGEKIEINAKVVVGADGVNSIVAKKTGLRKKIKAIDLDTSIGYEMINVEVDDLELMEFYTGQNIAPRGYVWIFPKGENRANVGIGVGMLDKFASKTAYEYLNDFIKNHPIGSKKCAKGKIIELRIGAIPLGGPNKKNIADGVILVGDAAGQVHPITGGGMGYSIACGSIAGKVAADCINEGDVSEKKIAAYEEQWRERYGYEFQQALKLRKALEKASDKQLDELAKILTGELLVGISSGEKISKKKIAKIIIKRPGLWKLLGDYLRA